MGMQMIVSEGVLNPTLFTASKVFAKTVAKWLPLEPCDVLELGCGSGIASLVAAAKGHRVLAVDIDPRAIGDTLANAGRNQLQVETALSDWDSGIDPDRCFDRVICNPPFLPGGQLSFGTALEAGSNGEVLIAAIRAMVRRLKPAGRGLLMTSSQTPRPVLHQVIEKDPGIEGHVLCSRRHWQERLLFDELVKRKEVPGLG